MMKASLSLKQQHMALLKNTSADYSRPRANGIIAVNLKEGDRLIDVAITDNTADVMLFSNAGKVVRFKKQLYVLWVVATAFEASSLTKANMWCR